MTVPTSRADSPTYMVIDDAGAMLNASNAAKDASEQASQDSQAGTMLAALQRLSLPCQNATTKSDPAESMVTLHVLGADEKELPTLDRASLCIKWEGVFRRVASRGSVALHFLFIGPNMPSDRHAKSVSFDWEEHAPQLKLRVTFETDCRLYHDYLQATPSAPLLAVAYNAGLWGYDAWLPSLEALFCTWSGGCGGGHLLITSYTLQESEDDYDAMQACMDGLQAAGGALSGGRGGEPSGGLRWLWDCECNPHKSPLAVERRSLEQAGSDEDRTYRENHFWQCVTLQTTGATKLDGALDDAVGVALSNPLALNRTCQRCHCSFNLGANTEQSCWYHPESYGGETAQRWLAPGDATGGGGAVFNFWSCCGGGDVRARGCCSTLHRSFDGETNALGDVAAEDDVWGKRPGMS